MTYESDYIAHYGIKGQSWGVRRFQNEDGTLTEEGKKRYGYYDKPDGTKDYNRINKDAANDAREYARAKAYYGDGAGTRRKKIKNQISERMKDPDYKKAFDEQMKSQNMEEHQKAANRERKWEDTKESVGKTARGVKNLLLGVGSASIAALSIYSVAKYTGIGAKIKDWGKTALSKITGLFKPKQTFSNDDEYYDNLLKQESRQEREDRNARAAVERAKKMYSNASSSPQRSSGSSSYSRSSDNGNNVGDEKIRDYWSAWNKAAIQRQDSSRPSSQPFNLQAYRHDHITGPNYNPNPNAGRKLRYDRNGRPYWA